MPYAFVVSSMELSCTSDSPSLGPYRGKIFNEKMSISVKYTTNTIIKNVFTEYLIVLFVLFIIIIFYFFFCVLDFVDLDLDLDLVEEFDLDLDLKIVP